MALINKNVTTTVTGNVGVLTFNYSLATTNSSPILFTISPSGVSGSNANPNLATITHSNSFQFFNDANGAYKYAITNVILDNATNCSYTVTSPISLSCDMCSSASCNIVFTENLNSSGGAAPYNQQADRKLAINPIGGSSNKSYSWTVSPAFPSEIDVTGDTTNELTYKIYPPYFTGTFSGELVLSPRTITVVVTDNDSSGLCSITRTYTENTIKYLPPQFAVTNISTPIVSPCGAGNTFTVTWTVSYSNANNNTLYTCIIPFGGGTPIYTDSAVVNGAGIQSFSATLNSTGLQYTITSNTVGC
jgi:hypothetical protein